MKEKFLWCFLWGVIFAGINNTDESAINAFKENVLFAEIEECEVVEEVVEVIEEEKFEKAYEICDTDRELIIKLVYLEARGEPYEGKKAVASIVFNRLNSGYWGDTIHDVIYAKGQFTPASRIKDTYITDNNTWNECISAVDEVITNGSNLPEYVLYFRADYYFSWAINYTKIGTHCFSYLKKDYNRYVGE